MRTPESARPARRSRQFRLTGQRHRGAIPAAGAAPHAGDAADPGQPRPCLMAAGSTVNDTEERIIRHDRAPC